MTLPTTNFTTFTPFPINLQIYNSTNFALQALVFLLIHLNSPKCPLYWNFISGSDFKHITAVCLLIILQSAPVCEIHASQTALDRKNAAISTFKMAVFRHLGF